MKTVQGILWLVLLAFFFGVVGYLYLDGEPPKGAKKAEVKKTEMKSEEVAPELQTQFCSTIESAISLYRDLSRRRDTAREEKNGIVQQQLSTQMTSTYRARNSDIFRLLERNKFEFENWLARVEKIEAPGDAKLRFTIHPTCSPATSLHAIAADTPANLELLSRKRQGDRLVVSGRFIPKRAPPPGAASPGKPASSEDFEGSITEYGSMTEPEYSAAISFVR